MNPEDQEKQFRNSFNHILNDNFERDANWGHPIQDYHGEEDEDLEAAIKELFRNSHRVDASDVTVGAQHGHVKLSGTVKTQNERDYLLEIVKTVHGVGEVLSEIIVKTHDGILPNDIGRNPH